MKYDNVRVTGVFLPRLIGIWPCYNQRRLEPLSWRLRPIKHLRGQNKVASHFTKDLKIIPRKLIAQFTK